MADWSAELKQSAHSEPAMIDIYQNITIRKDHEDHRDCGHKAGFLLVLSSCPLCPFRIVDFL